MTKDILVSVFLKHQYDKALKAFDNIVFNTREIIRPARKMKESIAKKNITA